MHQNERFNLEPNTPEYSVKKKNYQGKNMEI